MTSLWTQWRLKSPASRLFTQPFIQVQIEINIKAPCHWPFVWGIHRWPGNSPQKWPVTRKMLPFHDAIMDFSWPMYVMRAGVDLWDRFVPNSQAITWIHDDCRNQWTRGDLKASWKLINIDSIKQLPLSPLLHRYWGSAAFRWVLHEVWMSNRWAQWRSYRPFDTGNIVGHVIWLLLHNVSLGKIILHNYQRKLPRSPW